jgi:hypothetical protein
MLPLMIGMGAPGVRGGRLCAAQPQLAVIAWAEDNASAFTWTDKGKAVDENLYSHPRQVRSGCRCLPDRTRHPRVHAGCRDLGQRVSGHLTDNVSMRALTLFHLIRATIICRSA